LLADYGTFFESILSGYIMKIKTTVILFLLLLLSGTSSRAGILDTTRVYGVTIDAINKLSNTVNALSRHHFKPTTRIVFDEWIDASVYSNAVNQIHNVSFIMGELLDSYYMNQYNLQQYVARSNQYLSTLGNKVDIWEVGNEVNGEWLGPIPDVITKIDTAYHIFKSAGKKTAITLYYNKVCYENPQNEMFRWVANSLPADMKNGLDYVWVSYYEDDCNAYQPNWQVVFDSLSKIFPNSKLGIGECGTSNSNKKASYIKRYYGMRIKNPRYVGGYFWWYYRQDCTPYSKVLWGTLDTAMCFLSSSIITPPKDIKPLISNYPNPFNPVTRITYEIFNDADINIIIYNAAGKEIVTLVNEPKPAGVYAVDFNAGDLSAGVYFCRIRTGNNFVVRKMLLVK
jgi:hypothetical protein